MFADAPLTGIVS